MDKIRTLLFGMTGLGNSAAETLRKHANIDLVAIFTCKRQEGIFPYYPCDRLYEMALDNGILVYEGLSLQETSTIDLIQSLSPELIVVSAFNQIIRKSVIQIPKYGVINIHPSLLPRYRGATPTFWAIMNGEKETGVSIHFIEDETIDSGAIIVQSRLGIMPEDTDGTLRYKLAALSETALLEAIDRIITTDQNSFPLQDESLATCFPKRTIRDGEISTDRPLKEIINRIRAMSPYPGAYVMHNNSKYYVKSVELNPSTGQFLGQEDDYFDLVTKDGMVRFFVGRHQRSNH